MNLNKLTGTLVYVQVNKPVDCFVKEKGQEWKASIIVDEDTADAWNEAYPKQTATVIKLQNSKTSLRFLHHSLMPRNNIKLPFAKTLST